MNSTASFYRRPHGFTLLELMVAMSVTAMIVTMLLVLTRSATTTWARSRTEVRAATQARQFLDQMARDLEALVVRPGSTAQWLEASIDPQAELPPAIAGSSPNTPSLTFFTVATDRYLGELGGPRDQGGDLTCVSYRWRFTDPIGSSTEAGSQTFTLFRSLVPPIEAFGDPSLAPGRGNDTGLIMTSDLQNSFQPFVAGVAGQGNFLCENVALFTIVFLIEAVDPATGEQIIARATLGEEGQPNGSFLLTGRGITTNIAAVGPSGPVAPEVVESGRLVGAELGLSVLSDAALARLGTGTPLSDTDFQRNVFHYSRRLSIPSP